MEKEKRIRDTSGFKISCKSLYRRLCGRYISVDRIYIMRTYGYSKKGHDKPLVFVPGCGAETTLFLYQDPGVYVTGPITIGSL